jgi:hypothetical protein
MSQAFQKEHWCSAENVPAVMVLVWSPERRGGGRGRRGG